MGLGLAAALAGMLLYALASVSQGLAASRAEGSAVLRHPAYLTGLGCDALAWVASLVALTRMPLFAVQSLLAGSLAITVLLARVVLHARTSGRDWAAIGVVSLGLVLVALSSGAESDAGAPQGYPTAVTVLAVAAVVALAALWRRGPALVLGGLAGVGFSGLALAARAVHVGAGGPLDVVREVALQPAAWALVASGVVGAVAYARALERGSLGPVTAVMWVVEVLLPGVVGVLVLGDTVRPGWGLAALAGVAVAVAGCVVLAFSPAAEAAGG
ncbi:hypothetical protein [Arsenicicoccus dermatophilus]|uniref:hypothetical protein n=1 Tax=Arsenicicoccus dermatophilus TaxID=1076331 RepID=UPI001F4D1EB7|nr:hypothetical protein [Arsenicicoccus dermatophilus]MCH8614128.1 hypothetical protein [Arsenicicoccus dermatophilus]